MPDGGNGVAIVFPELAFVFGAVGGDGRVVGVLGLELAIAVKEVRKAYFEKNVIFFYVFFEFVFMLDDSVLKGDTIWTDNVGVSVEIIFSVFVPDGHFFEPNLARGGSLDSHAGDDGCKYNNNDSN